MRSVSARVLGKKEGERATSKEETTMIPRERERERIGIRPPKMRNEKKNKTKTNEGQPRARFLPFSKKKTLHGSRVEKRTSRARLWWWWWWCRRRGLCVLWRFSLYNNCLFLFSFLPPSFFPLGGKHTFSKP